MENQVIISKLKPVAGGYKGLEVHFQSSDTNIVEWQNQHKVKFARPVIAAWRSEWELFKDHLKAALRINPKAVENPDISISVVTYDGGAFIINGLVALELDGGSDCKVETAKLDNSNYKGYAKLLELWERISAMTIDYVLGKQEMETRQIIMDFMEFEEMNGKTPDFTVEEIDSMSEEDKMEFVMKMLQDNKVMARAVTKMEEQGAVFLQAPNEVEVENADDSPFDMVMKETVELDPKELEQKSKSSDKKLRVAS